MSRRQSVEEKRAYNRERYRRNRDKILAQQKERYQREKDSILERDRIYYEENRERILLQQKERYAREKESIKAKQRARYRTRKAKAVALLGGKCFRCPMDHPAALDFHHRDPSSKLFSISDMITNRKMVPDDVFDVEVMKCDLLCKNCHAVEHYMEDEDVLRTLA